MRRKLIVQESEQAKGGPWWVETTYRVFWKAVRKSPQEQAGPEDKGVLELSWLCFLCASLLSHCWELERPLF